MLEAKFHCFSTHCKIRSNAPKHLIDAAILECERLLDKWNFYDANSALFSFNKTAFSTNFASLKLSEFEASALSLVAKLSRHSAFNPAIGAAFFDNQAHHTQIAALPDLSQPLWWVQDQHLHALCACDFGGVIKELAVDACAQILKDYFYVINFGGDLRSNNELNVWIKNPQKPTEPIASIYLRSGGALCTSANYERAGHILGFDARIASASVCWDKALNDEASIDCVANRTTEASIDAVMNRATEASIDALTLERFACLRCGLYSTLFTIDKCSNLADDLGLLLCNEHNHLNSLGLINFKAF